MGDLPDRPAHPNATGYRLAAKDVLPGEVYKDNNVRITAYQNHHGTWDYTYAYRVVPPNLMEAWTGRLS